MSKRALKQLVDEKHVRGWDDPRLYTLIAIRRRGVPPGAILSFISELGVTTATTLIQIARFEQSVRRYLETTVPRLLLVLDPVRVVIEDMGSLEGQELVLPFSPKQPEFGTYTIRMTSTIYIDQSDFREVPDKDFLRLSPGATVGLLQVPHPIKAMSHSKDPTTGQITEIRAVLEKDGPKPKAFIHWVPEASRKVTVRVHKPLFKSDNPMAAEGGFLADVNTDSEKVYSNALINAGFDEVRRRAPWPQTNESRVSGPEGVRFQAMRVAYFVSTPFSCYAVTVRGNANKHLAQAMDSDSTDDDIVLNQIVSLKEDSKKESKK
jgi:glutaminyl-tRNA synthetase